METRWQRFQEWRATIAGRRALTDLGFFAVLFTFVGIAYQPSLKHPPRADQWCFLVDTVDDNTVAGAVANSYSYNRTRLTMPGDTDLFRPVLFALLAAEKVLFEGRLALYQSLGLLLHAAVCVLLLVVMRRAAALASGGADPCAAGRDLLMYAIVTFFALNPCVQELVIWSHLHGYLLFLVLTLGAVACGLKAAAEPEFGRRAVRAVAGAWALTFVAAFTYELGQVVALLLGGALAATLALAWGWKRTAILCAAFVSVPVSYQVTNKADLRHHQGHYQPDNLRGEIVNRAASRATLGHAARYGTFTTAQPFFPSLHHSAFVRQRLEIYETVWDGYRLRTPTPALAVSYGVLGLGLLLAGVGLIAALRVRSLAAVFALALPAGLYGAYAAVTIFGRMNMRPGPAVLAANCYYTYTALVFALFGAGVLWAASTWGRAESVRRAIAAGLILLTAFGAEQVWRTNAHIAQCEKAKVRPLRAVQRFVDQHRSEPGFSFVIDYANSDEVVPMHGRPTPELLFSRWMGDPNPLYRVVIRDGVATAERLR